MCSTYCEVILKSLDLLQPNFVICHKVSESVHYFQYSEGRNLNCFALLNASYNFMKRIPSDPEAVDTHTHTYIEDKHLYSM